MAAYNPGTATTATKISDTLYSIDSFRGETAAYQVNVAARTCTCPHFTARLAGTSQVCKHVIAVEAQVAAETQQAPVLSVDAALARWEAAHAASQAAFAAVIATLEAPARPAVGTSTKTFGPTTDAEALAAIAGRR